MKMIRKIVANCRNLIVSLISIITLIKIKNKRKKCLLISNGSTLSGAPLVLLEAAKVLKKMGYEPVFFTEYSGPIVKVARNEKINIIVAPKFKKLFEAKLKSNIYDCVIVNTIVNYRWVKIIEKTSDNIIWWLHEGVTYIDTVKDELPQRLPNNVDVYCVSSWTAKALKNRGIEYKYSILPYGCTDLSTAGNLNGAFEREKLVVAIIGNICDRKNQVELLQNIKASNMIMSRFDFIFVGAPLSADDPYFAEFIKLVEECKGLVKYKNSISRDKMSTFYNCVDIVLCCSIDDPLPVVITEGMMFGKVIVTSSCTGQYDLVQDGINGFKYDADDFNRLEDIFLYIDRNRNKLGNIGHQARITYEKLFAPESFENKLCRAISSKVSCKGEEM